MKCIILISRNLESVHIFAVIVNKINFSNDMSWFSLNTSMLPGFGSKILKINFTKYDVHNFA